MAITILQVLQIKWLENIKSNALEKSQYIQLLLSSSRWFCHKKSFFFIGPDFSGSGLSLYFFIFAPVFSFFYLLPHNENWELRNF